VGILLRGAGTAGVVAALPEPSAQHVYVARQPIFDGRQRATAYELLYRSGTANQFDGADGTIATAKVIVNAFMAIGIDQITGGSPAFINFPKELLLSDDVSLLRPEQVVVEVLETVEPTPEVVEAAARLKEAGYRLALDDFVLLTEDYAPLLDYTDIIKVDFLAAEADDVRNLPQQLAGRGIQFLAEKVETEEEYAQGLEWGYELFQGYFFSRPTMIEGHDIPGFKANYLRILQEVNREAVDFGQLEQVVGAELSIATKLLKYLNSPAFGWRSQIGSIQHALVALGDREFRKWVSLVCLTSLGEDRPRELMVQSVVRANYCELLARLLEPRVRTSDYFMVGLLSHLEAIMRQPLAGLLDDMPLQPSVRDALLHGSGPMGEVLGSMLAFEASDWAEAAALAGQLRVSVADVANTYQQALRSTNELFSVGF